MRQPGPPIMRDGNIRVSILPPSRNGMHGTGEALVVNRRDTVLGRTTAPAVSVPQRSLPAQQQGLRARLNRAAALLPSRGQSPLYRTTSPAVPTIRQCTAQCLHINNDAEIAQRLGDGDTTLEKQLC